MTQQGRTTNSVNDSSLRRSVWDEYQFILASGFENDLFYLEDVCGVHFKGMVEPGNIQDLLAVCDDPRWWELLIFFA